MALYPNMVACLFMLSHVVSHFALKVFEQESTNFTGMVISM
jgi:hypothetical protein